MAEITDMITQLKESIRQDTFVRLTLSKNQEADATLKKVLIKIAVIKNQKQLSLVIAIRQKILPKIFQ